MREVICNFVLYRIAATLIVFMALRKMESNGSEIIEPDGKFSFSVRSGSNDVLNVSFF